MIDFRYHLVSIVSIFLALAVGIVLGAGPLQGQIGDTLTSEITQLRSDKAGLRAEVTALNQEGAERDAWEQATVGRVVSGLATGRGVAVVALPGVETQNITSVTDLVVAAGGTVASTTKVRSDMASADAEAKKARQDLADKLAPTLRVNPTPTGADKSAELIDRVLAAALASTGPTSAGQDASRESLAGLVNAKLIDVDPKTAVPAQLVIILANPVTEGTEKEQQAVAASWVRLATALDTAAAGSVMGQFAGPPEAGKGTSVVAVLRQDSTAADAVSTVDNASTSRGLAGLILALSQQESGQSGHYGDDEGATAPFAPLPKAS